MAQWRRRLKRKLLYFHPKLYTLKILNSSYSEFAAISCTSVYSFMLKGYKFVQETAENDPNSE